MPEKITPQATVATQRALNGARISANRRRGKAKIVHPLTGDVDYQAEEMAFLDAMEDFKRRSGHKFPTWSEVLSVVREMGYSPPE